MVGWMDRKEWDQDQKKKSNLYNRFNMWCEKGKQTTGGGAIYHSTDPVFSLIY